LRFAVSPQDVRSANPVSKILSDPNLAVHGICDLPQIVIFDCLGLAANAIGIWRFYLRPTQAV